MAEKTYTVLTAIEHGTTAKDVKRYDPGEPITLDDVKHAPQLLAVGAIEGPVEAEAKAKK
jgi:hypothetical protein